MDVLGLATFDRPSAACLVRDGRVFAAATESLFSRIPDDRSFPSQAIEYCLRSAKIGPVQLSAVVLAGDLEAPVPTDAQYSGMTVGATSLRSRVRRWLGNADKVSDLLNRQLDPLVPSRSLDARLALAGAAFHGSPFRDAAGVVFENDDAHLFRANDLEIEFMESRPAGTPATLPSRMRELLEKTGAESLVFAGTEAPAAARLITGNPMIDAPVHADSAGPAAAALGAALHHSLSTLGESIRPTAPDGTPTAVLPLGPGYNASQIRTFLRSQSADAEELPRDEAPERAAEELTGGRVVAWFDGRVEFGHDTSASRSVLRLDSSAPLSDDWERVATIAGDHRGFSTLLDILARHGAAPLVWRPLAGPGQPVAASPNHAWDIWVAEESIDALYLESFRVSRRIP